MRRPRHWYPLLTLLALLVLAAPLWSQSTTVRAAADALTVQSPALRFIEGPVLARLRDGRSVQVMFEFNVLARQSGPTLAQSRQTFNLSFDLWEERVAASRAGNPPRSISHLSPRAAEAWCLDNLAVPLRDLARIGRDTPFWIRLAYQVHNPTAEPPGDREGAFTLGTLIDVLSRRRQDGELRKSLEAGPFRLSSLGGAESPVPAPPAAAAPNTDRGAGRVEGR
ncbi:MAG: hypothetical protein ABI051_11020 [Vicinamibacterales bacterium]